MEAKMEIGRKSGIAQAIYLDPDLVSLLGGTHTHPLANFTMYSFIPTVPYF
jgi:hypothetical protein